jgi:murein DD-endopeptidase MepM/ murein hydrolase activator NlpD
LGCAKVEDGPKAASADSIGRFPAAQSPISDTSLRPRPEGDDPATRVRGFSPEVTTALKDDTLSTLTTVDSAAAARPSEGDLEILRGELIVPVAGVAPTALIDSYSDLRGGTRKHEALDILAPRGTPVLSAANGRVLKLFASKPGGLMVYAADSTERFILMYGHLDAYAPGLTEGQALRRGQQIGAVGTSGNAAIGTPHLHFAIARAVNVKEWWRGSPIDPYHLLTR